MRAANFARVVGGSTPANASDPENYDPTGIPWITPADLSGYNRAEIGVGRRSLAPRLVRAEAILPKGAILISSRAPVGYCAVAANPVATNQGFRSLVCKPEIDPFFLRYYVLYSREYLESRASGTTFKEISGSAVAELSFPIPPSGEQTRIRTRIDELFSEIEDGEVALGRARGDLGVYRRALLKAAVTGELTADWRAAHRPGESGAALLARILAARRARWEAEPKNRGKRYKEPVAPDTEGLPALPEGWVWASVDQVVVGIRNGIATKPVHGPDGFPILRISAVRKMAVDPSVRRWLAPGEYRDDFISEGDLLFTRYNGSPDLVGVCGVYRSSEKIAFPDKIIRGTPSVADPVITRFIEMACNTGFARKHIERFTKTTAGQHGVSGETIKSAPIPLPSLVEVGEVVARYHAQSDVGSFEELDGISIDLRQSILAAAFRGELV